jgi:hypothetical protein
VRIREITRSYLSTLDCRSVKSAVVMANGSSHVVKLQIAGSEGGARFWQWPRERGPIALLELLVLKTNKSDKSMAQHGLCTTSWLSG